MTFTIATLIVLLFIGMPVALSVLGASVVYFVIAPVPEVILVQRVVAGVESFPLLAVPFFVLAGTAMARGGIASRLLGLADALVGHHRGGLGQVNVVSSLMMSGMSGSANADAAIDAKVLVPVMVKNGYSRGFATALSAATGIIAGIIPPSIGLILYGLLAGVSVGALFMAGIVPGLLIAVALGIAVRVMSVRRGYGASREVRLPWSEIRAKLRECTWALMMPVLLLAGLRLGVFTPTELGAVMAIYALFVGVVVYREIALRELLSVFREAALATSVVMLIVATALGFSAVMTMERVPQRLIEFLTGISDNPLIVMLIINIALLLLGTVLEGTAMLVMVAPILAPLAPYLDIDPVQFGIVIILNLTIGAIIPPVGTVMYTACAITGASIEEFTREAVPFLAALLVVLALVIYVPVLTTGLPAVFAG